MQKVTCGPCMRVVESLTRKLPGLKLLFQGLSFERAMPHAGQWINNPNIALYSRCSPASKLSNLALHLS